MTRILLTAALITLAALLTTLGIPDADEIVERMFPNGEVPEPEDSEPTEPRLEGSRDELPERPQSESLMVEAVRRLLEHIKLQEGQNGTVD